MFVSHTTEHFSTKISVVCQQNHTELDNNNNNTTSHEKLA